MPKGVNGWTVAGTNDLDLLDKQPELFQAEKNGRTLTLRRTVLVPTLAVNSPPVEDRPGQQQVATVLDWRLHFNGYDIARGRSLDNILQKAVSFMERT